MITKCSHVEDSQKNMITTKNEEEDGKKKGEKKKEINPSSYLFVPKIPYT